MSIKKISLYVLSIILLLLIAGCSKDTSNPTKIGEKYYEDEFWSTVKYLGPLLTNVTMEEIEQGIFDNPEKTFEFQEAREIAASSATNLFRYNVSTLAKEQAIDASATSPFCLLGGIFARDLKFLRYSSTPSEAGMYSRRLIDTITTLEYEIYMIEKNVENKEVNVEHSLCDKYFEETLETADPESSKYNPSNPQYMPEPLPKTVLDWFNSQRLDWIRSKSNK